MATLEELQLRQIQARQKLARERLAGATAAPAMPAAPPRTYQGQQQPDGSFGATVPLPQAVTGIAPPQRDNLGVADPSMTEAMLRGGGRQFLDNMLGIPFAGANLAQQGIASGINALAGTNIQPLQFIPPSAAEVTADMQALVNTPEALLTGGPGFGQRYQNALERQQNVDIRFKEERPYSTNVGEVGGDIATIAATRGVGRVAMGGAAAPAAAPQAAPVAESILGRIVQTTGRTLQKAGGRALETGAEGAFLASLQDADPVSVGAWAAGSQVLGDISRPTFKKLVRPTTLMSAVGVATLVSLGIQQWTPGGLDRVLPTFEAKNKEAFMGLLLTGAAAAATGRPGANLTGSPALNELASLVPRGILEANLVSAVKDPTRTAPILAKFAEDPDYFGPKGKRLLTRALTAEGASLSKTVESLMDDREFRNRFNVLLQQQ